MIRLFAHPFSSYCQKVFIAFFEKDVPFELAMLDPDHPANDAEFTHRWPLRMMPLLVEGDTQLMESSVIIEWLERRAPQPALIPADLALDVRLLDRIFDNYVMAPTMVPVFDKLRPDGEHDAFGVRQAAERAQVAYRWLDERLAGREWAAGDAFTLADCAAAPALFYADWVHPIPDELATLRAYRARLLARPSVARCVEEGRPYRAFFPLGAPDQD